MPAPTVAEMLKYANLQMAAEALYNYNTKRRDPSSLLPGDPLSLVGHDSGAIDPAVLVAGNEHSSRFTQTEADKFVKDWVVVDHLSNTTTGFSGTLFQNKNTNEYVISIRSTEFIDDAARDSVATNNMEIATYGFAFGQIADMEAWYKSLSDKGLLPAGSQYSVTGYSLGGHLATAFNLLRQEDGTGNRVKEVVTFNGAGVGQVTSGTLGNVMQKFTTLRDSQTQLAMQFQDTRLGELYKTLSDRLNDGHKPTSADYALLDTETSTGLDETAAKRFDNEKGYIRQALDRIVSLKAEVERLKGVTDSQDIGGKPAQIPDSAIAQEGFDYQMAVIWSSENTRAMSKITGGINTLAGKSAGSPFLANQFDVAGRETTTTQTAMVADSQWHHGTNVDLFIEDQPLFRGNGSTQATNDILKKGTLNLNSEYSTSDFGDTHSLVLLVDSLNIQNTLLQIVPEADRQTQSAKMTGYLKAASNLKASWSTGSQGKAEGNVLENVLDGLMQIFTGTDPKLREGKAANGDVLDTGNTWADKTLREAFYAQLDVLQKSDAAFTKLAGKLTIGIPSEDLATRARTDFASLLTLISLSPIAVSAISGQEAVVSAELGNVSTLATTYTDWLADQSSTAGLRNYTDQYLTDRAKFLGNIAAANLANTGTGKALRVDGSFNDPIYFADATSGITLQQTSNVEGVSLTGPNICFGGNDGETLIGADGVDHLYGMGGDDTIAGGGGNDYLEGGLGNDNLIGGIGMDTLSGGLGDDTYKFTKGDGWDWIEDKGGVGHIEYDGVPLTGGKAVGTSGMVWQGTAGNATITYILTDWIENGEKFKRLSIEGPDGGMWIKGWSAGQLNIILDVADTTTPKTDRTILGDQAPIDVDATQEGVQQGYDELGNVLVAGDKPDRDDYLFDSTSDDLIKGLTGDDVIIAQRGGNDQLYGGSGDDTIDGGENNDRLYGEEDNDRLNGDNGQDSLDGGAGDDSLSGGIGDDYLVGGAGGDELRGDGGNDTLEFDGGRDRGFGGDGNDILLGRNVLGQAVANLFLDGGIGNDVLIGADGSDVLLGGRGCDNLSGGDGDDYLRGDMTATWVKTDWSWNPPDAQHHYGIYHWSFDKTDGTEVPVPEDPGYYSSDIGVGESDVIDGGSGNDWIHGGGGDDALFGGTGLDELHGGRGSDYVSGGDGDDVISGGWGGDQLYGDAGNDYMQGDMDDPAPNVGDGPSDAMDGNDEMHGGDGNDTMDGCSGNDTLFGDDGNDNIFGGAGNDLLIGGSEFDFLSGGSGNDEYRIAATDAPVVGGVLETIADSAGDDRVVLDVALSEISVYQSGNDLKLRWSDGAQGLWIDNGAAGAIETYQFTDYTLDWETLVGRYYFSTVWADINISAAGTILGGTNNTDHLTGSGGNTTFNGGKGGDWLTGSGGGNTYRYAQGDGFDSISNTRAVDSGMDAIEFVDLNPSDIQLAQRGQDLFLTVKSDGGKISVTDYFLGSDHRIDLVKFADGTVWDYTQTLAVLNSAANLTLIGTANPEQLEGGDNNDVIYGLSRNDGLIGYAGDDMLDGGSGNDFIDGGEGNDTLLGGIGNDRLNGGLGSDTYRFGIGDGQDLISDNPDHYGISDPNNCDVLELGEGIKASDVMLRQVNLSLELYIKGTTDSVIIENYFHSDANQIEQIQFADGETWDRGTILSKIFSGSPRDDSIYGIYGLGTSDSISGSFGDDALSGEAGDDTLTGGAGNDELRGGDGSDVYVFSPGDGNDVIYNQDVSSGRMDTLVLNGLNEKDIRVERWGDFDLAFVVDATGDSVMIKYYYLSNDYKIDLVRFEGGINWDRATIDAMAESAIIQSPLNKIGTADADTLVGSVSNDTLSGGAGNDRLMGGSGSELLDGGTGADTLTGGAGDDVYVVDNQRDIVQENINQGDDTVQSSVSYTLDRKIEHLVLTGTESINGTGNALDNTIRGNSGANILDGGAGNDILHGGAGDDTYRFGFGSGNDEIVEESGFDVIELGAGITPDRVELSCVKWQSGILELSILGTGDRLTMRDYSYDAQTQSGWIGQIKFDDGTIWDAATVHAMLLPPVDVNGYQAPDAFGNTTYHVDIGSGEKRTWGTDGALDVIELGENVTEADVRIFHDAGHLMLLIDSSESYLGYWASQYSPDKLDRTVDSISGIDGVEQIKFANGTVWDTAAILAHTSTVGRDILYGGDGGDTLLGGASDDDLHGMGGGDLLEGGADNDTLEGGDGNDTLNGGSGDDYLIGGAGSNTYIFAPGDGNDVICLFNNICSDILRFDGFKEADIQLERWNDNLAFVAKATGESVVISGYFLSPSQSDRDQIDMVQFGDGVVWNKAKIQVMADSAASRPSAISGNPGDDFLTGGVNYDGINGNDGNDQIFGFGGGDGLSGDAGNDTLDARVRQFEPKNGHF